MRVQGGEGEKKRRNIDGQDPGASRQGEQGPVWPVADRGARHRRGVVGPARVGYAMLCDREKLMSRGGEACEGTIRESRLMLVA